MECVVLGAGGMMPMPSRLTTSLLVRREGRMIMFDAGEGIQIALKRGGLGIRALDALFVSHLHADHVLGIPGILMFRAQCEDAAPLTIVGPPGIERFVLHTLEDLRYHVGYKLRFVEWTQDAGPVAWRWEKHEVLWDRLEHSTFCLGYRLEEADRPGKFDPEKAGSLGVRAGPDFGRLQNGESVSAADGRRIEPADVMGPRRRGRTVAFATDTRPCEGLARLCREADIAFVEGMFAREHEAEAAAKMHMTAAQAARVAAAAKVGRLVLVHISPRYTLEDEARLAGEAQEIFPEAVVGRGLDAFTIPLPD